MEIIRGVPTNIVTGFLGVGKTTAILNLLAQKPADERWAVLVNEFGEVGVDASLMNGAHALDQEIFVREVPGGCMCCAAGLPMLIALNQLLSQAKPHRLIIEPTGLGHPKEVIQVLSHECYRGVLDIQQCITLVDARKLADKRYTEHPTFNQQLDVADKVIGHKADLYTQADRERLANYIAERRGSEVPLSFAQFGELKLTDLVGPSAEARKAYLSRTASVRMPSAEAAEPEPVDPVRLQPACGYQRFSNRGEGFQSVGWRFDPQLLFNRDKIVSWLSGLAVERAKGVFITPDGIYGYNLVDGCLTEMALDDCLESRVEVIFSEVTEISESDLVKCLL